MKSELVPPLLGVSHITLSVRDLGRATSFWTDVFGFELFTEREGFRFLIQWALPVALMLVGHGEGTFDEHQVGLDHLAFAVPDEPSLRAWLQRLEQLSVPHTPIIEGDGGHHINLRAPDNLALELYVINDTMATALGLSSTAEAVIRIAG